MGETSVILEAIDNEQTLLSLYSTIDGAGRVVGGMEAKSSATKCPRVAPAEGHSGNEGQLGE
jgi:hypothetical protein